MRGSEVFAMLLAPWSLRQYRQGAQQEKSAKCVTQSGSQPHTKSKQMPEECTEACLAVRICYHDQCGWNISQLFKHYHSHPVLDTLHYFCLAVSDHDISLDTVQSSSNTATWLGLTISPLTLDQFLGTCMISAWCYHHYALLCCSFSVKQSALSRG